MENHGFGHQADLIIAEPYTATFSLTLHSSKKGGHRKKTESRREAQNRPQITKDELKPSLTILGTRMRAKRLKV
jgi:hypothetical protein